MGMDLQRVLIKKLNLDDDDKSCFVILSTVVQGKLFYAMFCKTRRLASYYRGHGRKQY
jgi:hypothetical protein